MPWIDRRISLGICMLLAFCVPHCGTQRGGEKQGDVGAVPYPGIKGFEKIDTRTDLTDLLGKQAVVHTAPFPHHYSHPCVIADSQGYRMWVELDRGEGIESARSADGIEWSRDCGALTERTCPCFEPEAAWEAGDTGAPSVVVVDGTYHLFYRGGYGYGIGHAVSPDGIDWTRGGTSGLVLDRDEVGLDGPLDGPNVLFGPDSQWSFRMWFCVEGGGIRHARSSDGDTWFVDPEPVLSRGRAGEWDGDRIGDPMVSVEAWSSGRRVYRMLYAGSDGDNYSIGYAASWDGIAWEKFQNNPVLDEFIVISNLVGYTIDEAGPAAVRAGPVYLLWFSQRQLYPPAQGIAVAREY